MDGKILCNGDKFYLLTVIKKEHNKKVKTKNDQYLLCRCECGNETLVWEHNLISGKVRSCGCLTGEISMPVKVFPNRLRDVKCKKTDDGQFVVFENGDIFRCKGDVFYEASKSFTSRGKKYATVSGREKNKRNEYIQKHYYVHRLVADVFIPNPENKPQVNHIDGNPSNNHVTNLEWVTARQNTQHAYDTGLIKSLKTTDKRCLKCKGPTLNVTLCPECNVAIKNLKYRLKTSREKRDRMRTCFENIEIYKPRYQLIIRARFRGDTLESIGETLGVSRERVRQLEKDILNDKENVFKTIKMQRDRDKGEFKISLKEARKTSGDLSADMANKLGVSTSTYSRYENYERVFTVDVAFRFCEIVSIPFEQLDFIGGYIDVSSSQLG